MERRGTDPAPRELAAAEVLRRHADELGAAEHPDEALASAAAWIRADVDPTAVVGFAAPDPAGHLRSSWRSGSMPRSDRTRSAHRRQVFDSGAGAWSEIPGEPDRVLGMLPLVYGGRALGILEVVARRELDETDRVTLELLVSYLSLKLGSLAQTQEARRELEALRRVSALGNDLIGAKGPEQAVRICVRFLANGTRSPVAGWSPGSDGRMHVTSVHGLGSGRRSQLQDFLPSLPQLRSDGELDRARQRFADVAGVADVSAIDAGGAVILVGGTVEQGQQESVRTLLAEVLRLLAAAGLDERWNEQTDLGLAWTAHELRGPLLGVRAVLDLLLHHAEGNGRDRTMLRSSLRELDRVVDTAEAILTWSAGARPLRRRPADVVRVVEDAVESCRLETGRDGVVVFAPRRSVARIDADQLRSAVANLVRNAVAYADPGTSVQVRVEDDDEHVLVSVEDEGPSIPALEQARIFDPFTRGSTSGSRTDGSGLGLFIARRVVEAHGGRIWVESSPRGTTFRVMLPAGGRERRFAS